VVEVYDEFFDLVAGVVSVCHHYIGRMQEAFAVYWISFSFVDDDLIDALFAQVAAEVILIVFVCAA
jgi:hypothetical protein